MYCRSVMYCMDVPPVYRAIGTLLRCPVQYAPVPIDIHTRYALALQYTHTGVAGVGSLQHTIGVVTCISAFQPCHCQQHGVHAPFLMGAGAGYRHNHMGPPRTVSMLMSTSLNMSIMQESRQRTTADSLVHTTTAAKVTCASAHGPSVVARRHACPLETHGVSRSIMPSCSLHCDMA